jgi:hypothetical protein
VPDYQDQEQAISKALRFAETAYGFELEKSARETQEKIAGMKSKNAARGILLSGGTLVEATDIYAAHFTALLRSRLALLLEGFAMHGVNLNDGLVERVIRELAVLRSTMIQNARDTLALDPVIKALPIQGDYSTQLLEQKVEMRPNEIRTQLELSRYMPKKPEGGTVNVYHVHGSNNRWLTNSQDYSVNVVTQSSDQIFASLHREIETKIPAGEEKQDILEKLAALKNAENTPSFKQRYTEFIAAAANHVVLLTPFIPALAEMLHKAL